MSNLIRAVDIVKRFANHTALDKVSLRVPEGSIFGLLGPNGAGKTTLIRIINNITAPDEGEIYFGEKRLESIHTSQIGYLPEERGLYKKMRVGEQALYLAQLKGLSRKEALKQLHKYFEKFGMQAWWGRKVEELSKGMQQKVQFIITVLHNPKLLIFDEPFSGFDPINVNLLKDELFEMKSRGATIIFSTHNMASVEELCDNIMLINKSRKILEGEVKQIKKQYKSDIFEVEFSDGNKEIKIQNEIINHGYAVMESIEEDGISRLRIKVNRNCSPNKLLEIFMNYSTVHSFREIFPSMNDIFISMVEADRRD